MSPLNAQVWNGSSSTADAWRTGNTGIGISTPKSLMHLKAEYFVSYTSPGGGQTINPPAQFMLEAYEQVTPSVQNVSVWQFQNQAGDMYFTHSTSNVGTFSNKFKFGIDGTLEAWNALVSRGTLVVKNSSGQTQFKVFNDGTVRAREIQVDLNTIPDYVFEPSYPLLSLDAFREYLQQYKHLPNVPSAADFEAIGYIELQALNLKLLEKVEEQALYILQLDERLKALEARLEQSGE